MKSIGSYIFAKGMTYEGKTIEEVWKINPKFILAKAGHLSYAYPSANIRLQKILNEFIENNKNMDITKLLEHKEEIATKVHDTWWEEKMKQGIHPPLEFEKTKPEGMGKFVMQCSKCHQKMYSLEAILEHTKRYDRITVQAVLDVIAKLEFK